MDKRKVESLRDLAIAHFPKAREKRAQAIRLRGDRFADFALHAACLGWNPEFTAVEMQARYLLQITFMHPNAQPMNPINWDPVKDAEDIIFGGCSAESHSPINVELQPKIEAEMLDAARLLCELTGAALPPWVDAAPVVPAGASDGPSWSLKPSPERLPGYRWPLYCFLLVAHDAGKSRPKPIEVLSAWREKLPPEIARVAAASIDYYDADGNEQTAGLEAIRKAIGRMTGR